MPPEHGVTRYDDYGCRCEVCREANAERHRAGRARRALSEPEDNSLLAHGTKSTYANHGCRCDLCVDAQRRANRSRASRARSGR